MAGGVHEKTLELWRKRGAREGSRISKAAELTRGNRFSKARSKCASTLSPHFPSSVDIQCGEKAILL